MTRGRLLLGLSVIIAVALVAATDGWVIRHFGAHAATDKGSDSYLNAIACPSTARCWAVGQIAVARGGNTSTEVRSQLIEEETAGTWRKVAAPTARVADPALTAITCPGTRDCWAVGGSSAKGSAIIEHWTGGTWQLARSPKLTGAQLQSVSCASASLCWAYGGQQTRRNRTSNVLELWDGTRWRLVSGLAGGLQPTLSACPAAGRCLILGLRGGAAVAVSYDHGRWRRAPWPGSRLPELLACTSAASCLAVLPGSRGVTEEFNGRSWTGTTARPPPYLAGLACSAGHGCWLLGSSRRLQPLALRWQGGGWIQAAVTGSARLGYLGGLACGHSCWAIGGRTSTLGDGSAYSRPLIAAVAGT